MPVRTLPAPPVPYREMYMQKLVDAIERLIDAKVAAALNGTPSSADAQRARAELLEALPDVVTEEADKPHDAHEVTT